VVEYSESDVIYQARVDDTSFLEQRLNKQVVRRGTFSEDKICFSFADD
jgi:hypothetical protein